MSRPTDGFSAMMSVLPIAEHHSDGGRAVIRVPDAGHDAARLALLPVRCAIVSRPVVKWLYRLEVRGLEHVPTAGGLVVAANHTSNLDPWPLCHRARAAPAALHGQVGAVEAGPAHAAPLGSARSPCGAARATWRRSETAVRLCRRDGVMAMFPEGTRRTKGLRKKHQPRPHTGTARIALAADVPLLPAAISGMDRLSPPRSAARRVRAADARRRSPRAATPGRAAGRRPHDRLWAEIQRLEAELEPPTLRRPDEIRLNPAAATPDGGRRRLARPPRLPRAAEDDRGRRRPAGQHARRASPTCS